MNRIVAIGYVFRRAVLAIDATQWAFSLLLVVLSAFMLLPIVYLANHAFKPYHELFLFPPTFYADQPNTDNFFSLFQMTRDSYIPLSRYMFNTLFVTVVSTVLMIATSAICAYPLSKHRFPGDRWLFSVVVGSLMFVPEVLEIPRYLIVARLGLTDTYWGHVLPIVALPVGVFLLKQFMDQIPDELLEAARIDGAGETRTFLTVVMPVVLPAIATVGIIAFQTVWSNQESSTLFMHEEAMKTLAFFLNTLTANLTNSVARQGEAAAGALLLFAPQLVAFLLFQRKVIATMAHSGIK